MGISAGIVLIAIGVLLAVFVNSTVGIILAVLGVLAIVLGGTLMRPGGRDVVIERERPVRREVIRER